MCVNGFKLDFNIVTVHKGMVCGLLTVR